jgi:hypothetical protein
VTPVAKPTPVDRLRAALGAASSAYRSSPREAVRAALKAAYVFLEDVGLDGLDPMRKDELLTPLFALVAALEDLDRNQTSPILEAKPAVGHPRDPHGREVVKGAAGATMELLMTVGRLPREEAAKRVARKLREQGIALDGRRELNWRTVASWRHELKHVPMRDVTGPSIHYRNVMAHVWLPWKLAEEHGLGPRDRARFSDDCLAGMAWMVERLGNS